MSDTTRPQAFIIQAFDRELWCAVVELRLLAGVEQVRDVLGSCAEDDPALEASYSLDGADLANFEQRFGLSFAGAFFNEARIDFCLFRQPEVSTIPYLVHTGFELPLLLDGRKQLANMYHEYPPKSFEGEAFFDRWVEAGVLTKDVKLEPHPKPSKGFEALRTVFYTRKGEEWRIRAFALLRQAAAASGGWNEHFERLEGMLYGYEPWQVDWWIANRYRQAMAMRKTIKRRQ